MSEIVQAHVFKPSERLELLDKRKNLIGWVFVLLAALLFILDHAFIGLAIGLSIFAVCYFQAFLKWGQKEKVFGSFPVKLNFYPDGFSLDGEIFRIDEIKITKFICYDYEGRDDIGYVFVVKFPMRSSGSWNHLSFISNGREVTMRFRLRSELDSKKLTELKIRWGIVD
ncbi:MAG: hypothetical protein ACXIUD_18075 [Mongoliitalea sp.]